jgi:hypothetical protein
MNNMQHFKPEDIQQIESELEMVNRRYLALNSSLLKLSGNLKQEKAKEYLFHGALRRLRVIYRCINNIFTIFPIERESLLDQNELDDVMINLHAFFVNISGVMDNLAWVFVYEKGLANTLNQLQVGLFKKETKDNFSTEFRQYLDSIQVKTWHDKYLKDYRDTLSHRIPLYVPPKTLNSAQRSQLDLIEKEMNDSFKLGDINTVDRLHGEEDKVGDVCPFFMHSLSESKGEYVALHVQIITDFKTIEEIAGNFLRQWNAK